MPLNPDKSKRRMPRYPYTKCGYYLITLVTEDRLPLFGQVKGASNIERGREGCPYMEYTTFGRRVVGELENGMIGTQWEGKVEVKCRQIMEDHIHVLYLVKETLPKHLGHLVNGFHTGCRKILRECIANGTAPRCIMGKLMQSGWTREQAEAATRLDDAQRHLKQQNAAPLSPAPNGALQHSAHPALPCSAESLVPTKHSAPPALPCSAESVVPTTLPSSLPSPPFIKVFEDGYNDGIVLRKGQLHNYIAYIRDNMRRLLLRREHPQLFRKVWRKELIPGHSFDLIGNMFLLDWPHRMPVRISRYATDSEGRYLLPKRLKTEAEIAESILPYMREAEKGAVLVTPCISPAEQAVVQSAYERGLRVIMLSLRGFGKLYKPSGRHIDACSNGLLLQIAPWEYDSERPYTKTTCESLNTLASLLCNVRLSK